MLAPLGYKKREERNKEWKSKTVAAKEAKNKRKMDSWCSRSYPTPLQVQINAFLSSLWPSPSSQPSKHTASVHKTDNEAGKDWDEWKDHLMLSAPLIQVPNGPLAFPLGRMKMLTLRKCQTTFYLLVLEQEGGQKSGENKINRNSTWQPKVWQIF